MEWLDKPKSLYFLILLKYLFTERSFQILHFKSRERILFVSEIKWPT